MAVKNTLMDLSDTLFEQLERLNEADTDALESEVQRARAMCGVAGTIIENANTVMGVIKYKQSVTNTAEVPRMLTGGE